MVLQGLVPPLPSGTGVLTTPGAVAFPPLCPGSSTTTGAGAGVGDGDGGSTEEGLARTPADDGSGEASGGSPAAQPERRQPERRRTASAPSTGHRRTRSACHALCRYGG